MITVTTIQNNYELTVEVDGVTNNVQLGVTKNTYELNVNNFAELSPSDEARIQNLEDITDGLSNGSDPLAYYILAKNN